MATKMIPVGPEFNLSELVQRLSQAYQAKGFSVNPMGLGDGVSVVFAKDNDGIKKYIGLAQAVTVNLNVNNGVLVMDFVDAEWTGKIIGYVIGWFCCLVPFVTAIIGTIAQINLPSGIESFVRATAPDCNSPLV